MPRVVKPKAGAAAAAATASKRKATAAPKRSKLYAMPEKITEGTILTDLSKTQWRIGASIGTGGFGEIYSASRVGEKSSEFVVKCEPHGNGPLFVEMHFYMRNARLEDIKKYQRDHGLKSLGMPYMLGNGSAEINGQKHRFIVMPRYGREVQWYFLANGRRLPEGTSYRLALQMLDVYEFIHGCGYAHSDLKGGNILMGYGRNGNSQAYLVDYGLAALITTKEFKPDPRKMHNGTIEYTSRDAHQGVATIRSDLEILGYNLIEWLGGQLPWNKEQILKVPVKVQAAKESFMADVASNLKKVFPKNIPTPLIEFMAYVAKLEYNEKPDYKKCRGFFADALKKMKIPNSGDLELQMKGAVENGATPTKKRTKPVSTKDESDGSSVEGICASEDDDDDVIFEKKKPIKTAPAPNQLKTGKTPTKTTPTRKRPQKTTPPASTAKSPSPPKKQRTDKAASGTPEVRITRSTPPSARPSPITVPISGGRSGTRFGKTVINDRLTPNARAMKTYEFNLELDVSVDANVIVNVKRKKKAPLSRGAVVRSHEKRRQAREEGEEEESTGDTPVTRVKIRKVSTDENANSPRTPLVTIKKSKRLQ